jgi:hypothetical protein
VWAKCRIVNITEVGTYNRRILEAASFFESSYTSRFHGVTFQRTVIFIRLKPQSGQPVKGPSTEFHVKNTIAYVRAVLRHPVDCRPYLYHPVALPPCNILWIAARTLLHNREQLLTRNHEKSMTNSVCARPMCCYLANHTQLQLQRDYTN